MFVARLFLLALCSMFSILNLTASITSWTAPTNNLIPPGSSTSFGVIQTPIYDPTSNQIIQTWISNAGLLYYATYNGTSWSEPANNAIPLGASTNVLDSYGIVYDPSLNQIVLVWQDSFNNLLYYATYNGTSWSAPVNNAIPLGAAPTFDYYSPPIYDFSSQEVILTWLSGNHIYYATYNGTWSAGSNELPLGLSAGVNTQGFSNPVYDPSSGKVVQVWTDSTNNSALYYATYNGTSWNATSNVIPLGSSSGVGSTGYDNPISYPSSSPSQVVIVWQDSNSRVYYAAYNGTSWTAPVNNQLPLGSSSGVSVGLFGNTFFDLYDPLSNQLLMEWQDNVNNNYYYAVYNGTTWTASANNQIPLGNASGVFYLNTPVAATAFNQYIQTWIDNNKNLFYAIYNGTSWSVPTNNQLPLGSATGDSGFFSPAIYDPSSEQVVQIWNNDGNLYYAIYGITAPSPPASFSGHVVKNRFLLQTDRIYKLLWTPANDPTIVSYLLRRNGELIYTASATGPYSYEDHNRNKKVIDVYQLTSQNQSGIESTALTVTFK